MIDFKSFLIKYAEIGVKGKNRYLFEDALVKNIVKSLESADGEFKVRKEDGRIYVDAMSAYDYDEVINALSHVFGIVGICPMIQVEDNGFDDLKEKVIAYMDEMYPDKNTTFKVYSRRARKNYPLNSQEINMDMGAQALI